MSQRCGIRKTVAVMQNGTLGYFRSQSPSFEADADLLNFAGASNVTFTTQVENLVAAINLVINNRQQQIFDSANSSNSGKSVFKPMRLWVFLSGFRG